MVYTNSIPQANQTVSFTQPGILGNTDYVQNGLNKEHNFPVNSASDGSDLYHKQASMTNQALLAAFPVAPGTVNGCYYVTGGQAYFFDGTKNYPLSPFCIRAAVNFDGTPGSPSIRSSFNVTSVARTTHSGANGYLITFTTAMPSVNYCVQITGMRNASDGACFGSVRGSGTYGNSVKVGSVEVEFFGSTSTTVDTFMGNVIVFGG